MADPISVVGLVAGLASLGIQVCGGITNYLDAVKCRADDIASARRQAQSFKNVLQVIQATVTQVDSNHRVSIPEVVECIKSCEIELKTLESFVSELTGDVTSPTNFKGKIKEQTRKLSYAFNRSKLDQLEARLARANGIFQTAVQSLALGISASANKTLGAIEINSRAISTELLVVRSEVAVLNGPLAEVNDSLPTIQRSVDSLPPLLAQKADSLSTQLHNGAQGIRDDLGQLQSSFQASFVSNRDQLDRIEQSLQTFDQSSQLARMERMLGELVIQGAPRSAQAQRRQDSDVIVGRLVAKPSSLRALCDEVAAPLEAAQTGLKGPSRQFGTPLLRGSVIGSGTNCICRRRRRYQQQRLRLGTLELYDETTVTEEHLPDCQISQALPRHRHRSLGVRYTGAARLLDRAVNMAFSMTFGAGGFSLAPVFTYYATVDDRTAPAFQLLHILRLSVWYLDWTRWNMLAETALKKILKLFRERKASPTDVNSMNKSLLHITDYLIGQTGGGWGDVSVPFNIFKALTDYGVPITYDATGMSPLINVFEWVNDGHLIVAESLLSQTHDSALVALRPALSVPHGRIPSLIKKLNISQRMAEAYDCGPLSLAILANDVEQVKHILIDYPSTIWEEKNLHGQTPLHLAADKPECLQLLLQMADGSLLNQIDTCSHTAVAHALYLSRDLCHAQQSELCDPQCICTSCLGLLLDADCACEWEPEYFKKASMRSKLKYVEGLQNRRERLKHLALEHLSPVDAEDLGLYDGNVLDSVAGRVIERLHKHRVPVPVTLLSIDSRGLPYTNRSIYFDLRSATDAELFFRLGFRDLNTTGTCELTPLAYAAESGCSIAYILWLIEHGADVSRCLEYSSHTFPQFVIQGATNAHWLSGWIGDWIPSSQNVDCLNPEEGRAVGQLNAIVLRVYARDGCRCRCSIGGCSPLLWMLGRMYYDTKAVTSLVPRLAWYMEHFGSDMSVQQHKDSVRFITFETLRIQHTCCRPKSSWDWPCPSYDFEEIQEIEEEEAALLEILEDLVAEFEGRVMDILEQESTETLAALVEFWTGYWCDRMEEVLDDLNGATISDEERLVAERIGVRWYDEPDEEPEEDKRDIKYWYRRIDEIA